MRDKDLESLDFQRLIANESDGERIHKLTAQELIAGGTANSSMGEFLAAYQCDTKVKHGHLTHNAEERHNELSQYDAENWSKEQT